MSNNRTQEHVSRPAIRRQILGYIVLLLSLGAAFASPSRDESPVGPTFTDVTAAAGLEYQQSQGFSPPDCLIQSDNPDRPCTPERMSGGAAAGDVDGDGYIDLYVTRLDAPDILFRNRGDGTFEDVTAGTGLDMDLPSNGAAWGDIDNDGDLDLYVTTIGARRFYLFINDGTGRFTEEALARGAAIVTTEVHVGYSVTFGDYDRDGWLDIHTTEWRPDWFEMSEDAPSSTRLLRNRGPEAPGFFEDVTVLAGVMPLQGVTANGGVGFFTFASAFTDLDDDGWPDLAVAADFGTSRLYWNNGDGTFTDGTEAAGVGTDHFGMGSALGDYDGDGRLDWFVTSIFRENRSQDSKADGNRLYRNEGGRVFSDRTDEAGVRHGYWGWGAVFLDYDNDGDLDLAMTNGMDHIPAPNFPFRDDPMRFWRNDGGGVMTEMAQVVGLTDTRSGKGLLTWDYDNDGDLDLFVVNNASGPVLYRNDGGNASSWLRVSVQGQESNREGLGARVTVRVRDGGPVQVREIGSGSHFLGQSEPTAHFGLGPGSEPVAEVKVRWPRSGAESVFHHVERDRTLVVLEPVSSPPPPEWRR